MTGQGAGAYAVSIALLLALSFPRQADGYDFQVYSRTEAYAYQVRRFGRDALDFVNRRRVAQYLGLRVFNLLDSGQHAYSPGTRRPPALLQVHALMRFFTDFGQFGDGAVDELRNDRFELLSGSLEGRNLWGYVNFSLGRQFDVELMDFFAYDGLRLRLNSPWKLYLESHFGFQVDRDRPFSPAVFESDGTSGNSPDDDALGLTSGLVVGIDDLEHLEVRVAYRRVDSYAGAAPAGDAAGDKQALWAADQEILFTHLAINAPRLGSRLSAGLRYNFLVANFDEIQLQGSQMLGPHQVVLELLQARPHFDGDSIFNLFALEPYSEVAGRGVLQLGPGVSVEGRLGYREFWRDEADEADADTDTGALSSGLLLSWTTDVLGMDLDLLFLDGYGGQRFGGDMGGQWRSPRWLFGQRLLLEGRLSVMRYRDGNASIDPLTTYGLQLGGEIRLLRDVRLHLTFEDNISRLFDSALRFLAVLDMSFSP